MRICIDIPPHHRNHFGQAEAQYGADGVIDASGLDQVMADLRLNNQDQSFKAAYRAYQEANMDQIKADHPSLRLSQWR